MQSEQFGRCSRRVPWAWRRQAARLLEAVTSPEPGFDAIIVGESERAFTGTQLLRLAPIFLARGVQVWLLEVDGPVDLTDPAHQALIMQLGERSRRDVARARYRTTAAMRVQARDQGRYLGGRPPYGYGLVDAARTLTPPTRPGADGCRTTGLRGVCWDACSAW